MVQSPPTSALGRHVIADFWGASRLLDPIPAELVLARAAEVAKAELLQIKLHDFGERDGFTGVALLAESHISIHTWPEHDYAAIDVFMCGDCDPMRSIDVLRAYFEPSTEDVQELRRGLPPGKNAPERVSGLRVGA